MSDPQRHDRRDFLGRLGTAAAMAAAVDAMQASGAEPPHDVEFYRPEAATGASQAVVVGPVPLVHTEQLFAPAEQSEPEAALSALAGLIERALGEAGSSVAEVVKWNFYVADDAVVGPIRKWLAERYAADRRPAATFVTGNLALKGSRIGADCIAVRRAKADEGRVVRTSAAAVLPPTHKLYVSGDARPGEIEAAVLGTLAGLENSLKFAGCDWSHVVQLKSFLEPIGAAEQVRGVFKKFFGDRPIPAASFVEWHSPSLPIEIELVAAVPPERTQAMQDTVEYLTPPGMTKSPVYSRAALVRSERMIYTSGLYGETAADTAGRVREILTDLRATTTQLGGDLGHLVKATYYVSDDESSTLLNKIRPEFYDPERPPAASKAAVRGVGRSGRNIVVDMIAAPKAG